MLLTLPTDALLLAELQRGRNIAANLALEIDRAPDFVNKRLRQLADYRLVERVGPTSKSGLYEITPRGLATLDLVDSYQQGPAFEERVDARAEDFEIVGFQYLDHAESNRETESESGEK